MANVKYRLTINENLDTKCYFHLFMHTWIITIKQNIQSHFDQVITHRSVTRSWESQHKRVARLCIQFHTMLCYEHNVCV